MSGGLLESVFFSGCLNDRWTVEPNILTANHLSHLCEPSIGEHPIVLERQANQYVGHSELRLLVLYIGVGHATRFGRHSGNVEPTAAAEDGGEMLAQLASA